MSTQPYSSNKKPVVSTDLVDQAQLLINQYEDVVDNLWKARHIKLILKIGNNRYIALAERARKYAKPDRGGPKALMGYLVNQELKK